MAAPHNAIFKVEGGGRDAINGYYRQFGRRNGRPQYHKVNADGVDDSWLWQILWQEGTGWGFYNGGGKEPESGETRGELFMYANESDTPVPNKSGWKATERAEEWGANAPNLQYIK